jgi:hypothetical protein
MEVRCSNLRCESGLDCLGERARENGYVKRGGISPVYINGTGFYVTFCLPYFLPVCNCFNLNLRIRVSHIVSCWPLLYSRHPRIAGRSTRIRPLSSMSGGELLKVSGGNRMDLLSRNFYGVVSKQPGRVVLEFDSSSAVPFYTATLFPSRPGVNLQHEE